MEYKFFYISAILVFASLFICAYAKGLSYANIIIAIASIGYSLIFDIIFGDRLKLFYYINPQVSTLYMVLAVVFIYAPLNIIYTRFIPDKPSKLLLYTGCWIVGMIVFEYISLLTKTIVFTGWRLFPWSIVIYFVTYIWIYCLYKYSLKKFNCIK